MDAMAFGAFARAQAQAAVDMGLLRCYDVLTRKALRVQVGLGGYVKVSGLDRSAHPDDTVIALVLDQPYR